MKPAVIAAGMQQGSHMLIKKYFLMLAAFTVSGIALLYGLSPSWFAHSFLGVATLDVNFTHILRAVMGLYLGFGLFWLLAAFDAQLRGPALITTLVFAGGLFAGRLLSFLLDGASAPLLQAYALLELGLLPVAYWVYRRPD